MRRGWEGFLWAFVSGLVLLVGAREATAAPAKATFVACVARSADENTENINQTDLGAGQPSERQVELVFAYQSRGATDDGNLAAVASATTLLEVCHAVSNSTTEAGCTQIYPNPGTGVVAPAAPSGTNVLASTTAASLGNAMRARVPFDYGSSERRWYYIKVNGEPQSAVVIGPGSYCPAPGKLAESANFEVYAVDTAGRDPWGIRTADGCLNGDCVTVDTANDAAALLEAIVIWQGARAGVDILPAPHLAGMIGGKMHVRLSSSLVSLEFPNQDSVRGFASPAYMALDVPLTGNLLFDVVSHEYFHRIQQGYARINAFLNPGSGFTEGTAAALEDHLALRIQDIDPIFSGLIVTNPERRVSAGTMGQTSWAMRFQEFLGAPQRNVFNADYSAAIYWRYFMEQYGLPRVANSRARPSLIPGTSTATTDSRVIGDPTLVLGDPGRAPDEGVDILSRILKEYSEFGGTVPRATDTVLRAHLGRSFDAALLDMHTAVLLKDYAETDQRWHYEWVGDFQVGAATSISAGGGMPPAPPTKPFTSLTQTPDGLSRVARIEFQTPINATTQIVSSGDPRQNVNAFGAAYLSFIPDATANFSSTLILETASGNLRYRVFTVDADGEPTLHPQCSELIGEGPDAVEQCPLTRTDDQPGQVVLTFDFAPGATPAEILVVVSAGSTGGAFDYAFVSGDTAVVEVLGVDGDPGLQNAPRPVLGRFTVSQVQSVGGSFDLVPVEVTADQLCVFVDTAGGTRTEVVDFDLAPFIGDAHWATLRLPASVYPAMGQSQLLGLIVQYVDSTDTNPCGQRRVIAEGGMFPAFSIADAIVTTTPTQLVLDSSHSMLDDDGAKIAALRLAANYFVTALPDDTPFGIVQFNTDASTAGFGYEPLGTVRGLAADYINGLVPSGCTAIGDGLLEAQSNFAAEGYPPNSHLILISDGGQNAGYHPIRYYGFNQPPINALAGDDTSVDPVCTATDEVPDDVAPWFDGELRWERLEASRPRVSTLLVGDQGVFSILLEIAQVTGGVFDHVRGSGATSQLMKMSLGMADGLQNGLSRGLGLQRMAAAKLSQPGQLAGFGVEGGSSHLRVSMLSVVHAVPAGLRLRAPSGTLYAPVRVAGGAAVFEITSPEPGAWTWVGADAQSPTAEPSIFVEQALKSRIGMFAGADVATVGNVAAGALSRRFVRRPVYLRVALSDAAAIQGADVSAVVRSPSGVTSAFSLFDDGVSRDGAAGDGIYGAVMTNTSEVGTYIVNYTASGMSGGGTFRREKTGTIELHEFPDQDGDQIPDYADRAPTVADANADPDSDLLTNLAEFQNGTNPTSPDTDGGGELDGSEVLSPGGTDPKRAADDRARPGLLRVTPCAGKVILNLDSTDDDEARIEHSQDGIFGPFSPVATVSPIPEDGLIAVQAQNNEDHCFRVRTVSAGEPQATWSAAECVRVQDDPQEPMLAPELRSSSFNRTLSRTVHVALNAADPPAGTTGDVRRVLPGCDGNVSGVAEMQLSFTDPRTTTVAWQPYQAVATLTLPLPERESYLLYARVRDVAGNESKVATLWIHLDELEFSDIVLYARNFLRISDGARVEMAPDLGIGAVVNSGAGGMLLSPDAVAPNLFSQSNVTMHARSQVLGTVYTGGVFIPSANAVVQGGVNEHALLDLPPMPVTSIPGGSGENITLNSGQSRNLNPGTYGNVTVNSGATLRFNQAGTYVFASLKIQSSSTVLALVGSPLLKVRGTLEFRSSIRRSAGSPLLVFTNIQSNTTGLIVIEAPFSGTVLAPQASLRIGNGSATFNSGSFFARDIEVHPHTTLRHAVTVPPTCSDGVKNGNETDVDCGGATTCARCANGRTCGAATDCTSGICTGGTCRAQVSATVQVFSDTGSNYCARLRVTNNNSVPTTNWSLTLNYNGSVRTSGTNAMFSSNTGTAIVTPAIGHRVIQPGATRDTVTFCANRFGGGTASVVSASGTY